MADVTPPKGTVFLVGAGPGDPGLITLRGIECLRRADVVLYDYLVNPVIAEHAPAKADLLCVGKHGSPSRVWTQDEINKRLVELANEGKTVVRLKGGDPAVFARGGEEVAFLVDHAVPVEIVPGITAALAAGSHAGISITHRDHASAVALVTGRERPGKPESDLDFEALARFPGTLVFYMGVTTVAHWTQGLLSGGMSPDTPVALVRRCSRADQQTLRCRLDEVEANMTPRSKFPPPVIAIVGSVAGQPQISNWFEERPLFGQTIVVTRPAQQAAELGNLFAMQGAHVVFQPAIAIGPPSDVSAVLQAMNDLETYDWIVFSSANGVSRFIDQLQVHGKDARALGNAKIAAVGSSTARVLSHSFLRADVQPEKFDGPSLAAEIIAAMETATPIIAEPKVLLVRANRGRPVLPQALRDAGAVVDEVAFYESKDVTDLAPEFEALWSDASDEKDGKVELVDWVTVTSSAIARALVALLGKESLSKTKIASISPVTSATLREFGLEPAVEADPYTMPALVDAVIKEIQSRRASE